MFSESVVVFLLAVAAGLWLWAFRKRRNSEHVPGPLGFPVFGHMPLFFFNPLKRLQKLAIDYPEACTIYLGGYRVLVLNSFTSIREAFRQEAFNGRPCLKMFEIRNGGNHIGLVCNEGRTWKEQRGFTLRQLKGLGFGKMSMEGLIQQEVEELGSWLQKNIGLPINLQHRFNLAVLNALWYIIGGQRYPHEDKRLANILRKTSADLADTEYTGPMLFLPWLLKLAPGLTRFQEFSNSIRDVHKFLQEIVSQHKKRQNEMCTNKDFIDLYIEEIERTNDPNSSFYKSNGEHSLLVVLLDLFMAGSDTTSATLYWSFLYMIRQEDIQRNVQSEIDRVIGNRTPTLDHQKLMPYTEATLMEVLRKSSLAPMGLFHSTTCDTELMGYKVPKDTIIMANLYNLNSSERYWDNPEAFRPERFLNQSWSSVVRHENFIPFSTGKRSCPGEGLAQVQLFLFFVGLLQKFTFLPDPSRPLQNDNPKSGIILSAPEYYVQVEERKLTTM